MVKNKKAKTVNKVSILGHIPIVGLLFTYKADTVDRTDLLVFITPHILTEKRIIEEAKKRRGFFRGREYKVRIIRNKI